MLGLLLLVLASPLPAPSPGALIEIGRVRSRAPLCTTLREAVAPSLLALMRGDTALAAGHDRFVLMGRHEVMRSRGQLQLDRLVLDQQIGAVVRNLRAIDTLLADPKRFPAKPVTDDDRRALEIKAQLQAVARAQNHALNVISGTVETDRLGEMQTEFNHKMQAAVSASSPGSASAGNPSTSGDPDLGPVSFLNAAGVQQSPNTTDAQQASGAAARSATGSSVFGHTLYDGMAGELSARRLPIDGLERTVSSTIVDAAQRCTAEPAPSPTP